MTSSPEFPYDKINCDIPFVGQDENHNRMEPFRLLPHPAVFFIFTLF
jgi:hypothetical protein